MQHTHTYVYRTPIQHTNANERCFLVAKEKSPEKKLHIHDA